MSSNTGNTFQKYWKFLISEPPNHIQQKLYDQTVANFHGVFNYMQNTNLYLEQFLRY